MKKWSYLFFAAAITCGTAIPAIADTVSAPANDHAYLYADSTSLVVGSISTLRINFSSNATTQAPVLQVQTTLGSLNGKGSSVTLNPQYGANYDNLSLSSTVAGTAVVSVYENGVMIGSNQVIFLPGALGSITVQASPANQVVGGTSTISIQANDIYGNLIPDNTTGTKFNLTTTAGQLTTGNGLNPYTNGNTITISTHNGVAQALLTDSKSEIDTVTVADVDTIPSSCKINGNTGTTTVNIPVNFNYAQTVSINPVDDFLDTVGRPAIELSSERELSLIGVLHGDPNHYFYPDSSMKRSEFATVVAQYMGLSPVSQILQGTQTKFVDVDSGSWYDGVIAADASLGYIHGDGTNFYPEKSISYAEVAMILLNNLGATTTGSWPNNAISGGQTYGLFKGLGSFNANDPATRGDVAIMVRNALHLVPPSGGLNTNGKTLESEMTGYTWYGDDQPTTVTAIPGNGTSLGNELQVQTTTQTTTLHLANSVQMAGATSLNDLMNKQIKYLTNAVGLVTYIEVTP